MYKVNQLKGNAQLKAKTTVKHILNAHRKSSLGINMDQFELATRELKFDMEGNILAFNN